MTGNHLKSIFYNVGNSRVIKLLMKKYKGIAVILAYHQLVSDEEYEADFSPLRLTTVSLRRFEEQIKYLSGYYRFICMGDLPDYFSNSQGRKAIVITFDDGYKDVLHRALPVLEKYQVPATVYITTAFPENNGDAWHVELARFLGIHDNLSLNLNGKEYSWRLKKRAEKINCFNQLMQLANSSAQIRTKIMESLSPGAGELKYALSWEEIRKLDKHSLITLGAHTHNHLRLSQLSSAEAEFEVTHSKMRLEEELGHKIGHFAYPYGGAHDFGKREVGLIAKCGFKTAVTMKAAGVQKEHRDYLYALPRYHVSERDTISRLESRISGWEAFVRYKGKRVII